MQFNVVIAAHVMAKNPEQAFVERQFLYMTPLTQYTRLCLLCSRTTMETKVKEGTVPAFTHTPSATKQDRREAQIMAKHLQIMLSTCIFPHLVSTNL